MDDNGKHLMADVKKEGDGKAESDTGVEGQIAAAGEDSQRNT